MYNVYLCVCLGDSISTDNTWSSINLYTVLQREKGLDSILLRNPLPRHSNMEHKSTTVRAKTRGTLPAPRVETLDPVLLQSLLLPILVISRVGVLITSTIRTLWLSTATSPSEASYTQTHRLPAVRCSLHMNHYLTHWHSQLLRTFTLVLFDSPPCIWGPLWPASPPGYLH